ncbi:MAG: cytochrome c oxidase assembly protein [Bacteroidota bacterium]|nr:cytochrome c oxidase assembly protein [Bacteroidota bacterium]
MRSIYSYWSFDFITIAFILFLCLFYLYIIKFHLQKQSLNFLAGIFLLLLCVCSPLHFIGENYLFSIHMLTHTIILLIAAPLLVAGVPKNNRFRKAFFSFSKKTHHAPFVCWLTGVMIMWIWHVPAIFNHLFMPGMMPMEMHHMNALSYFHMLSLLVAGMVFCLPIINPYSSCRISPASGVLYLTSACVFCSLLGLLITFAPQGIYTHYTNIQDMYGFLPMIRNDWNISAATDLQAGGLIMWVPCCFIYLTASMVLLIKWLENKSESPAVPVINL